jgi:hypothetical protein
MTNTKELTIMFFDADRGWVTDTLEVEADEPDETTNETVREAPTYYI